MLGTPEPSIVPMLSALLTLHDIGKFAKGFQALQPDLYRARTNETSLPPYSPRHDAAGLVLWDAELRSAVRGALGVAERGGRRAVDALLESCVGHHGRPVTASGQPNAAMIFGSAGRTAARTNAEADGEELTRVATPDGEGVSLLAQATERMKLSTRGYHQVLKVARTLADLDGKDGVRRAHVAEALSYRRIAYER